MANTTNLNMTKLAGTEKQKTFPTTFNGNMDAIDGAFGAGFGVSGRPTVNAEINSLADGLAIISNNNTHAAITAGQFVYVRGHGSLSDGLYVATSNISANGTLSGSNLTADSSGGLNTVYNALNSKTAVTLSPVSGVTITNNGVYKNGNVVCGSVQLTLGSSIPSYGDIATGFNVAVGNNNIEVQIYNDSKRFAAYIHGGVLSARNISIDSGTYFFSVSYIVN